MTRTPWHLRYEEDGDFSSVNGEPSHGRKELEQHYQTIFSTFLKNAHTTDTVRSIRFLAPDLASVDIDWLVNERQTRRAACPQGAAHLDYVQTQRSVDDHDLSRASFLISRLLV